MRFVHGSIEVKGPARTRLDQCQNWTRSWEMLSQRMLIEPFLNPAPPLCELSFLTSSLTRSNHPHVSCPVRVKSSAHSSPCSLQVLSFLVEKMREVISVHVGQAGVQIGNACCECLVRPYLDFVVDHRR